MVLGDTEKGPIGVDQGDVMLSLNCSIPSQTGGAALATVITGLEFTESEIGLTFMLGSANAFSDILTWLGGLAGEDTKSFVEGILKSKDEILPFQLRRLNVSLDKTANPDSTKLSGFSVDIELPTKFGKSNSSGPTVFVVSYHWNFDLSKDLDLSPFEEDWTHLAPVTASPADCIDPVSLVPGQTIENVPDTIPTKIKRAITAEKKDSSSSAPQPYLGEVGLDATDQWGQQDNGFTLDLGIAAGLKPSASSQHTTPAVLKGALSYSSKNKTWGLSADADGTTHDQPRHASRKRRTGAQAMSGRIEKSGRGRRAYGDWSAVELDR
ncbi:hypothetical protein QBC46DRAFT_422471 [Diplogelasinospora grovesii]|uniref:Uncharacterized protein n=1 Tax=Diplogelasinospora grovesii TaxID=303347 RepID=A0AAN6S007_9PEZI|nr:hypothetical protein QBC46DRAFT_422471 [Diplogelasinospora grovesii]